MGGIVQQDEGREGKLGRHIAHVEGLRDIYKYRGKRSFSVLSQTILPLYNSHRSSHSFTCPEITFLLFYSPLPAAILNKL